MKRREFIRYGSLAAFGTMVVPPAFSFTQRNKVDENSIKKVHLIFKTHLDIGFTKLAGDVIKTYMDEFIPGALTLSEQLRQSNSKDRYVWTTGSWLIYKFLNEAAPDMRSRLEKAIERGDIVWHGLPFTTHSEVADPSLYNLGLQLSAQLDKRFGKKTISAKMTDVPGHTRGIVPLLAKNGIQFLHIGVNSACPIPDVPPLFVWRAPDQTELVVMYHGSYGSQMVIPGTQSAIAVNFTGDNHGPHKPEQIAKIYADLRKKYPNAEVVASTFNDVAAEVAAIRNQLPVVTQEIGDTWIHGVGSDPLRISQFREMSRLRKKWLEDKSLRFGDKTDLDFGLPLLMIAEHTWGFDVKKVLKDWDIYTPEAFQAARNKENFKLIEQSWAEKRAYIQDAIAHLPEDKALEAKEAIKELKPEMEDQNGFTKISTPDNIDTPFYKLKIDAGNGGVIQLKDKITGKDWANKKHPLCLYSYQTFSQADYDRFHNEYLVKKADWALADFGKPGMKIAKAKSETWFPTLEEALEKNEKNGKSVLLKLKMIDKAGKSIGGSPENITVKLFFPSDKKEMQATLQWFNKKAYRLPEASWFSFVPEVQNGRWIVDKMGQVVDCREVVKDGNRKLHGITENVTYESSESKCVINSLDAALVAPGERNLLNFNNRLPEDQDGMHFCLHNNVWGTNFTMWFEDDMKYRFTLKV
ncbi:MAG: DUF5054 domain-containing protein [Proteiniphilum sp.]